MERLLQNQLFVKARKCEFHMSKVSFLGLVVTEGKVSMDPEKIRAAQDWPAPISRKEVQRFLGFENFYKKTYTQFQSYCCPFTCSNLP